LLVKARLLSISVFIPSGSRSAVLSYARVSRLAKLAPGLFGMRDLNISSYDASYLELALREDLPLATLDKALQKAAHRVGVQLL